MLRLALEDATNDATTSAARTGELLSRSEEKKKYIAQVLSLYLVAQFGLTTWVVQSSTLHKSNTWSPLALSTMAAGLCFIPVWQYGTAIAHLRGDMHDKENNLKAAEEVRSELRKLGLDYAFPDVEEPKSKKRSTYLLIITSYLML